MNGLEERFSAQVDFFVLDVDEPETAAYMEQYLIRNRSTYVLLDGNGEELGRWAGPLNEAGVAAQMERLLGELQ